MPFQNMPITKMNMPLPVWTLGVSGTILTFSLTLSSELILLLGFSIVLLASIPWVSRLSLLLLAVGKSFSPSFSKTTGGWLLSNFDPKESSLLIISSLVSVSASLVCFWISSLAAWVSVWISFFCASVCSELVLPSGTSLPLLFLETAPSSFSN